MARKRRRVGVRPLWGAIPVDARIDQVHPIPGWVLLEEVFMGDEHMVPGTDVVLYINIPFNYNTMYGVVLAVHPITANELGITLGSKVIYKEWQGGRWAFTGQKTLIMPVEAILARL